MHPQACSYLKVLLLTNKVPFPAKDGSSIAMKNMALSLLHNNVSVTMLSINTKKHFIPQTEIQYHLPKNLSFHTVFANTSPNPITAFFNLFSLQPYHISRFRLKKLQQKLNTIFQEEDFDIIQFESLPLAVYLPFLRKQSHAKMVYRAHNVEYKIWESHLKNTKNPLLKWYLGIQNKRLKRFEEKVCKDFDGIVAITQKDEKILRKLHPNTCSIPCGVQAEEYPTNWETPKTDIAYVASFDWLPNIQGLDWFVDEVWPTIQSLRPETTCQIGGRKLKKEQLIKKAPTIHFSEHVPSMPNFIGPAKVAIIPLLAGSGMRIKLIEYMALAKCTICTTIGALGIHVKNQIHTIIENDSEKFAHAIVECLENKEKRKALGENARKFVEKEYNNHTLGQKLVAFYMAS